MIFYHFTSVALAESIVHSGISNGHLCRSDGTILQPIVWLTTDSRVEGHGLLTGGTVSKESQRRYIEAVQGRRMANNVLHDKTQVRLRVRLPRLDRHLVSFRDWSRRYEKPGYARIMGLSAVRELEGASDEQIIEWHRTLGTKEDTWWLYRETVPPAAIEDVAFNLGADFAPYAFEEHGRSHFREAGFSAISKPALDELGVILPPSHKFDHAKAFCFFTAQSFPPHVVIRGGGLTTALVLVDGMPLRTTEGGRVAAISPKHAELSAWVARHQDELHACWQDAIQIYRNYHPNFLPE
jgi:hypothetical protein